MKPIEMADRIGEIKSLDEHGYMTFTAEEDTTLTLDQNGGIAPHKLLKSTDGVNWSKWENPATNGISLNAGQSVYLKADEDASNRTSTSSNAFNSIASTGKVGCRGDVRSIINIDPSQYDFWLSKLFKGSSITTPPELPATTLAGSCYTNMFNGCSSLTNAPELPATNLADWCYSHMFEGCSALEYPQDVLPATTLADWCYNCMFYGCIQLRKAPHLPAENLANNCYEKMFNDCGSLVEAPALNATTLSVGCYSHMFEGCSALRRVESDIPGSEDPFWQPEPGTVLPEWVLPATSLSDWCYNCMFKNCISLEVAPTIMATTTGGDYWDCFNSMFQGCTNLKRVKINLSEGVLSSGMFDGCLSLQLVDMTGAIGVPRLGPTQVFPEGVDYYIVVPDELFDEWYANESWQSVYERIVRRTDWNDMYPDDQL